MSNPNSNDPNSYTNPYDLNKKPQDAHTDPHSSHPDPQGVNGSQQPQNGAQGFSPQNPYPSSEHLQSPPPVGFNQGVPHAGNAQNSHYQQYSQNSYHPAPPAPPAPRDMTVAYAWLYFFGGIGAHKFYMRQHHLGLIYLSLWVVSLALTFVGIGFIGVIFSIVLLYSDIRTMPEQISRVNNGERLSGNIFEYVKKAFS